MMRFSIATLLVLAAPAGAFSPTSNAAVPHTGQDQTPRNLELEALLSFMKAPETTAKLTHLINSKKEEFSSVYGRVKSALRFQYIKHRHLQTDNVGEAFSTITTVLTSNNCAGKQCESFGEVYATIKPAICDGNSAKMAVANEFDAFVATLIDPSSLPFAMPSFTELVTKLLNCLCQSSWTTAFEDPAWATLWTALASVFGGDTSQAALDGLSNAAAGVIESVMSSNGMCSGTCKTATVYLYTFIIDFGVTVVSSLDSSLSSFTIDSGLKNSFADSSTECLCGAHIQWATFTTTMASNSDKMLAILTTGSLTKEAFTAAGTMMDDFFSEGFYCGGTCRTSWADGATLIVQIAAPIVLALANLPGATPTQAVALAPSLEATRAWAVPMTACLCNLGFATITNKFGEHLVPIVQGNTAAVESTNGLINTAADIMNTAMNGETGSGGYCDSGYCPTGLGKLLGLGMPLGHHLLTAGGYAEPNVIDASVLSVGQMTSIAADGPMCFCSMFVPPKSAPGFFNALKTTLAAAESAADSGSGDSSVSAIEIQAGVVSSLRAMKYCDKPECVSMWSTLHTVIGAMNQVTDTSLCTDANTAACLHSPTAVCNSVGGASIAPMKYMPDEVDRGLYWVSCSTVTDCPPAGVSAYTVTTDFTIAQSLDSFDAAAETAFIQNLVNNILAPYGSAIYGSIAFEDVTVSVTSGSIVVTATVLSTSPAVKDATYATLDGISNSALSTGLGVTVTAKSSPKVGDVVTSPAPPPIIAPDVTAPPSSSTGGDDSASAAEEGGGCGGGCVGGIVGGATGGIFGLVGLGIWMKKKKKQPKIVNAGGAGGAGGEC